MKLLRGKRIERKLVLVNKLVLGPLHYGDLAMI